MQSVIDSIMLLHLNQLNRTFRIAVIAHACRTAGGISVGQNLIAAMGRVAPEQNYFFSISEGLGFEEICDHIPHRTISAIPKNCNYFQRWQYDEIKLPRILKNFRPDVMLVLGNRGINYADCPQAMLCDNPYLFYPSKHFGLDPIKAKLIRIYKRHRFRRDLKRIKLLLCQTEVTEKRIREMYQYAQAALICPNAVSEFTSENKNSRNIPENLKPYMLHMKLFYLTRYYPHKNLEVLIELFRRYYSELKDVVVVITISKEQHPGAARLLKLIKKFRLDKNLINVGPLNQRELANYFLNCDALLMPTLLESFSGTYLEAMHFGLPILTSDLDFAHEICGDAALYFDPWNIPSIRDAILRFQNNSELALDLRKKGQKRISESSMSWDKIVNTVLNRLVGSFTKSSHAKHKLH